MKSKKVNFHLIFVIASITSLVAIYSYIWFRLISTPTFYMNIDFNAFYAAGRISQNEGPSHVYDLALQQKYEGQIGGIEIPPAEVPSQNVAIFAYPPYLIPLLQIIALDDYAVSLVLWTLLMVVCFILGAIPLMYIAKDLDLPREQWLTLLAGILLFYPCFRSIISGQPSGILYLGVSLWLFGILSGRDWLSALGLTLTAVKPHITLLLAVPFIFRRRNVWWWFMVGAAALGVITLAYVGLDGIEGFLRLLIVSAGAEERFGTREANMINFIGITMRIFPLVPAYIIRAIGWGVYAVTLIGLCVLWSRSRQIGEIQISIAVLLSIIAVPHLHAYDLVILMVPLLCLMLLLIRGRYWDAQNALLLPFGISVISLFSNPYDSLFHNIPYLVELFILLGLLYPQKISPKRVS